jgi:hypothetical protein
MIPYYGIWALWVLSLVTLMFGLYHFLYNRSRKKVWAVSLLVSLVFFVAGVLAFYIWSTQQPWG